MTVHTISAQKKKKIGKNIIYILWCVGQVGSPHLLPSDTRHKKTDHKVFVVVIPKEEWAHGRAHTSFAMTPAFQNLTLLTS